MKALLLTISCLVITFSVKSQSYVEQIPLPPGTGSAYDIARLDTGGIVWAMSRGQLYSYNQATGNVTMTNVSGRYVDMELFQGKVYIASNNGLCYFYNDTLHVFNSTNSPMVSDTVTSIAAFGNTLVVGTRNGLYEFDGINWQTYTTQNSPLLSNTINCVDIGGIQGIVYAATPNGLSIKSGQNWSSITTANQPIQNNNVTDVVANLSGVVWFFTTYDTIISTKKIYRYAAQQVVDFITVECDLKYYSLATNSIFAQYTNGDLLVRVPYSRTARLPAVGTIISEKYYLPAINNQLFNRGGEIDSNGALWLSASINGRKLLKIDFSVYPADSINDSIRNRNGEYAELYINKVKARVNNWGDMHWDLSIAPAYEVPKGTCKNAAFATGLWLGGMDSGGNLHTAAMTYRQNGMDFWPGPVDTANLATDNATMDLYNHIWNVDKGMIADFLTNYAAGNVTDSSYTIPHDILTWPGNRLTNNTNYPKYLAPFYDINADGIYNPYQGDYPDITGDQMLFSMYNDIGGLHSGGCSPMGIEVHQSSYAYSCDNIDPNSNDEALNYTTFYRYKIINRSTQTYTNFYVGLFVDAELGNGSDDFIGCDTMRNTGFVYNGDNDDEWYYGYGLNPPMMSYTIYEGPRADADDGLDNDHDGATDESFETCGLSNFSTLLYDNQGNFTSCGDYYNWLQTKYDSGLPVRNPFDSSIVKYLYPSTPYTNQGWSEQTEGNTPGDRRMILSSGPFTLEPGEVNYVTYGVTYSRNEQAPNGLATSIAKNNAFIDRLQTMRYDTLGLASHSCYVPTEIVENTPTVAGFSVYPNPTNGNINVLLNGFTNATNLQVIDLTGRVVKSVSVNGNNLVQVDLTSLPAGLYTILVQSTTKTLAKKFVKE